MGSEDRQDRHAQAAEIARLFLQLADERPAVLDALQALLRALTTSAPRPQETPGMDGSDRERGVDRECNGDRVIEVDQLDPPVLAAQSGLPAHTIVHPTPAHTPTHASPSSPSPSRQLTQKDTASLAILASKFGDIAASSGLGAAPNAANSHTAAPTPLGQWSDDVAEAKLLARLLRAQSRRLRNIRLAFHRDSQFPPIDGVLAAERIEDWTAQESVFRSIAPRVLKEGERWYTLSARAAVAIADWLDEHADAALGHAMTPDALRERLQCLANAQKGIYCWLEEAFGTRARCKVQERVMYTLKAWVARDYWAVYLASGMQLAQRITSGERDELERALHRFDLEHAVEDATRTAAAPPDHPPKPAPDAARIGSSPVAEGLESVYGAFEEARNRFGDTLLVFTERAAESAEDSAFKRPEEVYDFFEALHSVAMTLASGAHADPHALLQPHGFHSKPSHQLTMKRHHRFYHMEWEGHTIPLSQHVTLGSRNQNTCLSIHWWHDTEKNRFVIGHCGKHLPNTRS